MICGLLLVADGLCVQLHRVIKNDDDCVHGGDKQFVRWCDNSYLYLKVSKTKEMCIDLMRNRSDPKPVWIKGEVTVYTEEINSLLDGVITVICI